MDSEDNVDDTLPPPRDRTAQWIAMAIGGIVLVAIVIGLSTGGGGGREYDPLGSDAGGVDNLELAIDALKQRNASGASTGLGRALSYLNQWSDLAKVAAVDWKPEPLIKTLPEKMRERLPTVLDQATFLPPDLMYLQEALWSREITRWVTAQPPNADLEPWFQQLEQSAGADVRLQLSAAERLFDWTICNVALEVFPPEPKAAVASAGDSLDSYPPSMRGEPGPGYTRLPWMSLLTGRGDAWERSRVFICLARQSGIDIVMLGLKDKKGTVDESKPWLTAAFIGGKFYLFDAELGLPIPGPGGEGIATLEDVVADPKLLRALDLPGIGKYPVGESDLKDVVVLLDGPLYGLSRRMKVLEGALRGERRVKLAAFPADLPDRVKQAPHIKHVIFWRIAADATLYDEVSQQVRARDPAKQLAHQLRYNMYLMPTPLRQAREAYFRGVFTDEPPKKGARELYLACRPPDAELRRLAISGDAWMFFGLREPPKTKAESKRISDQYVGLLQRGKEDATFFLSLTIYEEADYELAREWFHDNLIEKAPDSPWISPARYMLGRSYEHLGKWEDARNEYLSDQSPQRYGNILRAAAIKRRHKAESSSAPAP